MEEEKNNKNKKTPKDNKSKEVSLLKEQNALLNEKILRITAEMQNMKRRYEEEISRLCKYDGEQVYMELLDSIDNFERAIKMDDSNLSDELSKFLEGFKLIYTDLVNILNKGNVTEIDALNKDFDANTMDAVMTEKVEGVESGKVIEVLRKGYKYQDKVLRHAMVKVNE